MAKKLTLKLVSGCKISEIAVHDRSPLSADQRLTAGDYLLLSFAQPSGADRFYPILDFNNHQTVLHAYARSYSRLPYWGELDHDVDFASVTYGTAGKLVATSDFYAIGSPPEWADGYATNSRRIACLVRHGAILRQAFDESTLSMTTSGSYTPSLTVWVDDTDLVGITPTDCSPSSGFIDRTQPITFRWAATPTGACCGAATQESGVFRWRMGPSGAAHTVTLGEAPSVTLPAGTIPEGAFQWQIQLTANSGATATSDWMTLTTEDALPAAVPVAPVGEMVDGSAPVTLRWSHVIATGTAPSGYDVQISIDGTAWSALHSAQGTDATAVTIPAGALPSGTVFWRVRTYNSQGAAGSWSDGAQIAVIAAPAAPAVRLQAATPRPTVTWQAAGQLAWEARIGDLTSGVQFGHDSSWRCRDYLPDGDHVARVRVQNAYGLWSEWGTAAVSVSHTDGAGITLQVAADIQAILQWTTSGGYDAYIIYRDGVPIARTAQGAYIDRTSVGEARYQIRGIFADRDDYALSNAVTITVSPEHAVLSALEGGEWIMLPYSAEQHQSITDTLAARAESYHTVGRSWPSADVTEWRDRSLSIRVAILRDDDAARQAILRMVGRVVILKTQARRMAVGLLTAAPMSVSTFFEEIALTVDQIDREEEIDLD